MRAITTLWTGSGLALAAALASGGCGKIKPTETADPARERATAHRQQAACGSAEAYDRLKGVLFDQATVAQPVARATLDTLADYSFVRMTNPVVTGFEPALQITRCRGRIVLEMPSAASTAFGGAHILEADVNYTAQASADGHGLVYRLEGAEPIVTRLAAFNLGGGAYRPPPAIDEQGGASDMLLPTIVADAQPSGGSAAPDPLAPSARGAPPVRAAPPTRVAVLRPALHVEPPIRAEVATPAASRVRDVQVARAASPPRPSMVPEAVPVVRRRPPPEPMPDRVAVEADESSQRDYDRLEYRRADGRDDRPGYRLDDRAGRFGSGEETVRAFYDALGSGDGETASAQVVPEKRGGRIYSPGAIARFYGRLPEPLRIRDIVPLARDSYRVTYRYATGRSRCDGTAIVSLTNRGGEVLIRSIRALRDC